MEPKEDIPLTKNGIPRRKYYNPISDQFYSTFPTIHTDKKGVRFVYLFEFIDELQSVKYHYKLTELGQIFKDDCSILPITNGKAQARPFIGFQKSINYKSYHVLLQLQQAVYHCFSGDKDFNLTVHTAVPINLNWYDARITNITYENWSEYNRRVHKVSNKIYLRDNVKIKLQYSTAVKPRITFDIVNEIQTIIDEVRKEQCVEA